MFRFARLRLTAWYLLIITLICIIFSTAIYQRFSTDIDRITRAHRIRPAIILPAPYIPDDDTLVSELRDRVLLNLIVINTGILIISGLASYWLAGLTLQPIEIMIDEQNRFTADASHELRTPLTALKTEVEVALRDKHLDKSAKTVLESNLEEINKLRSLADGLLILSHEDHGDQSHFAECQLDDMIHEAIKKVRPQADEKQITITATGPKANIQGDAASLVHVFIILFDNAIKYSQQGSDVKVAWARTDGQIVTTVEDQGIGIHPNDVPHIFKRFYRADAARSKHGAGGYGLGLAIAQQIIKRHRGSIKVKSAPNEGSTFTISLPALSSI